MARMTEFLARHYLWLKSLHIIFVIAWMAGLMYLPRLFVYHHQSAPGGEAERFFMMMERRLLKGIINPSLVLVWLMAALMLSANPGLLTTAWFLVKLACVLAITGVSGYYSAIQRRFERGERPQTERFWRIINEAPFILTIIVVFVAIMKPV